MWEKKQKGVKMVDVPERLEDHGPVFIYGVEGEQIEEENDAYNDLRYDIGKTPFNMVTFPMTMILFQAYIRTRRRRWTR